MDDARDGRSSLSGDLERFSAFDVCQLLRLAGATGTLVLRAPGVRGAIHVDGGRVVGARARPNPQRLGGLLVAAGAVTQAALGRALAAQIGGDGRRIGEILVAGDGLGRDRLTRVLATQARAALTALLVLPTGRFAFAPGLVPRQRLLDGADPNELVLAALARLDELGSGRAAANGR